MGLDLVELVIAVEDTFALSIPDAEASQIGTPGQLIDYLVAYLPPSGAAAPDLTSRALDRLRHLASVRLSIDCDAIHPDTTLASVFDGALGAQAWQDVLAEVGATHWPQIGRRRFLERALTPHVETFKAAAEFLVARCPTALQGGQPGWTRMQVAEVVRLLLREECGIEHYSAHSKWGRDLGLDWARLKPNNMLQTDKAAMEACFARDC